MKGIQIKINGQWIYLPEDFSISLEQTSPVFNEQGTFSFPFEIPLEPNRSVFKNIADPFGDISLRDIDKAPAEIWFAGVMLYRGIIEVDEEVELEDSLPVTFLSGNSDFMSRIEGMNCHDVPIDREIKLGYVVKRAEATFNGYKHEYLLPVNILMNYTGYNVSDPYPIKPYCNVRICTSNENGYYKVLEAKRPYSGVCFYVLYFMDCLFKHLNIAIEQNRIGDVEDMNRLAFFSTQCHTEEKGEEFQVYLSEIRSKDFCGADFELKYHKKKDGRGDEINIGTNSFSFYGNNLYATNENFPNIDIKSIFEDLNNAMGVRFLFDSNKNAMNIIYVKDILSSKSESVFNAEIIGINLIKNKNTAINLTYSVDDDTSFNYTDYSNVKVFSDYAAILADGVTYYDTQCKIDAKTGNAYRVKVNKDTGRAPSLFEVGGFRDYVQGEITKDEEAPETNINFRPVIHNLVSVTKDSNGEIVPETGARPRPGGGYTRPSSGSRSGGMSTYEETGSSTERVIATFVDVTLMANGVFDGNLQEWHDNRYEEGSEPWVAAYLYMKSLAPELFDTEESEESPLRTYDAGYTIGIMRGPGNDSGLETIDENYDGEGNSSWMQTVGSYAFTSDSCDNYGRFFDYNGTEAGGADQTGRFSLKLVAGKDGYPIDSQYADRGLVSKFLSEYLYFMANKKTVVLTVRMNITQIIGIDFLKRYRIGDFVGFINKVSYTLDVNGVQDATIELYTL